MRPFIERIVQDYSDNYASVWRYLEEFTDIKGIYFDFVPTSFKRYYGPWYPLEFRGHRFFYIDQDSPFYPSDVLVFSPYHIETRGDAFSYQQTSDPWIPVIFSYDNVKLSIYGDVVYKLKIGDSLQVFIPFLPLIGKITGDFYCSYSGKKLLYVYPTVGGLSSGVGCITTHTGTGAADTRFPVLHPFDLDSELSWDQLLVEYPGIHCLIPSKVSIVFTDVIDVNWDELNGEGCVWWESGIPYLLPRIDAKAIKMHLFSVSGSNAYWNIVVSVPSYSINNIIDLLMNETHSVDEEVAPTWNDNVLIYDFSDLFIYTGIYKLEGRVNFCYSGTIIETDIPISFGVLHIGDVDVEITKKTYVSTGATIVTYTISRGFVECDRLKYEIAWKEGMETRYMELGYSIGQLDASRSATDFKLRIYYNDELVKIIDITDINEIMISDVPLPIAYYISNENRVHVEWDNETYECYERLINITGTTSWVALSSSPYDWYPAVGVNLAAIYKLKHRTLGIEGPSITVEINNELVRTEIVDVNRKYIEVGEIEIDAYARRPQLYFVYDTVIPNGAAGFKFLVYGDFDEANLSYSFDGVHFQPFTMGDIIYFPEVPNLDHLWVRFESSNVRYVQSAYIKFIF